MLAIVEHEEQPLRAEHVRDTLGRDRTSGKLEPECCGNGDGDESGISQWRQLGDPHPVGKFRQQLARDLEAETRLADPSLTGQRN